LRTQKCITIYPLNNQTTVLSLTKSLGFSVDTLKKIAKNTPFTIDFLNLNWLQVGSQYSNFMEVNIDPSALIGIYFF
jgi:hypothetical protein